MGEHTDRLAVVVAKPRSQTVINRLTNAGVYDSDRSVEPWDEETVAIPVTQPPDSVEVREIVRQVGSPRLRDLGDHLRERGWTDDEIERAPSSWAVIGTVVLVKIGDCPRPAELGEALLAIHGGADTVLARGGIDGPHRQPSVEVIAGMGDTETVHTEHGTTYALDLADVMFSPGNKAERDRMGEVVSENERVLDMFAGIGYFTLPMARAGASVTAVERNPTAFRYLIENIRRNEVDARVQPYRADCRDVIPGFVDSSRADRVVMGYYDASEPSDGDDGAWKYLDSALDAVKSGGIIHMHEATPDALVFDRPIERLEAAAGDNGRSVGILDTRRVKGYSEGVSHIVIDARIE
jgi:tRNA wybutosine-synthesizing protein 2